MKRHFYTLGLMLAATFTLTNCAQEIENPAQELESAGYPFEIVVKTADTKTVNNDMKTEWVAGDAINLFHVLSEETTYINDGKFTISAEDIESGKFKGTVVGDLDAQEEYDWFAFYPYNENISTPANKSNNGYVNVGAKTQTQVGNSNMDHVAGANFPLAGVATYASTQPELTMNHLASLLKVHVTNNSSSPLTVTGVTFTGTEDIVGTYYIDFTDLTAVKYTSSGENYVSAATTLTIVNGTEIPVGGTADFYLGIKPFTAPAESKLSVGVNTCIKEIALTDAVTFTAGKIKTLNFSYVEPALPVGIANIKTEANEAGASFAVRLENAVVTYVSGSNAYIEDDEAGILVYYSGHGLKVGEKLNGDVSGTVKLYNGLREITAMDLTKVEKTSDAEVPVTVLTLAELKAEGAYDKYENMRIKIAGAEVTDDKIITQNGETYALYYKNNSVTGFDLYNIIDVIGYPSKFKTDVQFNVWENAVVKGASKTILSGAGDVIIEVNETVSKKVTASSGATVIYESGNSGIATVDEDGNITGVSEGETTITVSVEAYNGYPAATAAYNVVVKPEGTTEEVVASGTVLWGETWGDEGANSTTFASNIAISSYKYGGRTGYEDNATVTYSSDSGNNVRITKSTGANCTSGHLWFNKSAAGELVTSDIKLYGATSLTFSHTQGTSGSLCESYYSIDGGANWTKLGSQSGASSGKSYQFNVSAGTSSIRIKLSHPNTNSKNTRVDNLKLTVN